MMKAIQKSTRSEENGVTHVDLEFSSVSEEFNLEKCITTPQSHADVIEESNADENVFYFDISDLVQYFIHNRSPTGIQRVQIEIVSNLIDRSNVLPIAVTANKEDWKPVNKVMLSKIFYLSQISTDIEDPVWVDATAALNQYLDVGSRVKFLRNSYLVNLGTSWWIENYASQVLLAKIEYGIKYVPFIHDIIPIKVPEHCGRGLVGEFAQWIYSVLLSADIVLVNSEQTSRDVAQLALEIHGRVIKPIVCTLNAAPPMLQATEIRFGGSLSKLAEQRFALFVGTIESRKGHHFVFDAWLEIARTHGLANVPTLVCVGKVGWLNDAAMSLFNNSEILKKKVIILSNISDEELALLYRKCLFTIYNSYYEGWGLPVTESLCFGKIALTPNNTSLPEAGEGYSLLFESGNRSDFIAKASALIFDHTFRVQMETKLQTEFKPREWGDISHQILEGLRSADLSGEEVCSVEICFGEVYALKKTNSTNFADPAFKTNAVKSAGGWHRSEDWGTWTSDHKAGLRIEFQKNQVSRDLLVYLDFVPPRDGQEVHILMNGRATRALDFHRASRFVVPISPDQIEENCLEITFVNHFLTDLNVATNGDDTRFIGVGFCSFMICHSDDLLLRLNYIEREGRALLVTWQDAED